MKKENLNGCVIKNTQANREQNKLFWKNYNKDDRKYTFCQIEEFSTYHYYGLDHSGNFIICSENDVKRLNLKIITFKNNKIYELW